MKTASSEKRTSAGSAAGFEPDISILKVLKYDNQNNLIYIYICIIYIYIKNNKALFPILVISVGVLGPGVFGGEILQDGIRQESVTKMRETPSLIFQFLSSHIISYHHQATH